MPPNLPLWGFGCFAKFIILFVTQLWFFYFVEILVLFVMIVHFFVYSLLCSIFARKNLGERNLGGWKLEILLLSHLGNSSFFIFININMNIKFYIKIK